MTWQRDDDGTLIYESDSFWRAVVYQAAGRFGAYLEHPSEPPVQSPTAFASAPLACAWCITALAKADPALFVQGGVTQGKTSQHSYCPLCHAEVVLGQLQQHIAERHPAGRLRRPDPRRFRPAASQPVRKPRGVTNRSGVPMSQARAVRGEQATPSGSEMRRKDAKRAKAGPKTMPADGAASSGQGSLTPRPSASSRPAAALRRWLCPMCAFRAGSEVAYQEHLQAQHRSELNRAIANWRPSASKKKAKATPPAPIEGAPTAGAAHGAQTVPPPPASKATSEPGAAGNKQACPVCKKLVDRRGLASHISAVHGNQRTPRQTRDTSTTGSDRQRTEVSLQALEQSFSDRRDASRGMGHMRRDYDGTWGSMPLHDSFDDESNPY